MKYEENPDQLHYLAASCFRDTFDEIMGRQRRRQSEKAKKQSWEIIREALTKTGGK